MWLIPSKGRPELLKRCLNACVETGMTTPGQVLLHYKEPLMAEYLKIELPKDWTWFILEHDPEDPVESLGRALRVWYKNHKDFISTCEWVGWLNDDHIPKTHNWDKLMISQLKKFSIISPNDNWQAPKRMCGPTLYSGELIRTVGYIYPPKLNHMYIDDLWEQIGSALGIWVTVMDVIVEHDHWSKHKKPDQTTAYGESFLFKDKDIFTKWITTDASTVIRRVGEKMNEL